MFTKVLFKENSAKIASFLFLLLSVFWVSLFFFTRDDFYHALYGSTYGILAGWGGVVGLFYSKHWGGLKSVMGKALFFFSLGLLLQFFGQVSYSIYIYIFKVELPYPSIGDIGYFGGIPAYIYATYMLAVASGVKISRRSLGNKIIAILIPIAMVVVSYLFLLRGYQFGDSDPLAVILDFGYPFGQAIYVSLAILTFLLSKNSLGGIMRARVLFILFALVVQYLSDFSFIYLVRNELWYVGGINDYVYLISYFLMSLALISLKSVYDDLTNKRPN